MLDDYVLNVNTDGLVSPIAFCRCQAGDLSGKHGQLDLYSDVSNRPTYTFVDPNLQLMGSYSGMVCNPV